MDKLHSPLSMLRKLADMTQEQISKELGVSATTIRNWEMGRCDPKLSIPQTKKLCNILGITLDQMPDSFAPQPPESYQSLRSLLITRIVNGEH